MILRPPIATRTATLVPDTTLFRSAVPYSAGGGTDVVTRALSQYLGEGLNQQFIVENRGGANASIGAEVVATSKPDGYTLLVVSGVPFVLTEAIDRKSTRLNSSHSCASRMPSSA